MSSSFLHGASSPTSSMFGTEGYSAHYQKETWALSQVQILYLQWCTTLKTCQGNGGTKLKGVNNQWLIWLKAHSMSWNPYPTLLGWSRIWDYIAQGLREEPNNSGIKEEKMYWQSDSKWYPAVLINQCLVSHHQWWWLIPPAADGNKWDSQPDIMQIMRNLGRLSPKWDVSIISLPSRFREPHRSGDRKNVRASGDEGPQLNKTLYQQNKVHMNSQRLKQYS